MDTQRVGINELSYKDQGEGQIVILLHGFCGSQEYWEKVMPLLDQYRVIAVDLRGHGESGIPEGGYSIEEMAKDIHYFMDQKQLKEVYMLGHSLGGYVTLSFAENFPDKLKGFGLIHSTPLPDDERAKEKRTESIKKIDSEGMHSFIDGMVPNLFNQDRLAESKEQIDKAKQIGYNTSPAGAKETLKAMRSRGDFQHVIEKGGLPVLLVAGTNDNVVPKEKTFVSDSPNVKKVLLEQSGHMGIYEEPEKLAFEIKNFISENS
ncbi:alpha/beta hydrolase [Rossellomorea vietnamensis]|uniref:Alpha/beta hydrolase n=1 Tax=Rossellomorea vietnamensis TaxID=218284 RepID=A0A5D4M3W3_9BACI|nr:alpha/beta hydrolase [Rossellomorea vietnamensis]TYR96088.1 alpha/beta hydrolase [Rossellomorea vietnamensis]